MNATRLGSKCDARKALLGQLELLGSGRYRDVYCDRRRTVVYKVDHFRLENYEHDGNRDELDAATKLAGQPCVPQTTSWNVNGKLVVCQPMMHKTGKAMRQDGDADYWALDQDVRDVAADLGIGDLHDANWMVDTNGQPWITDIQMTYEPEGSDDMTFSYGDMSDDDGIVVILGNGAAAVDPVWP